MNESPAILVVEDDRSLREALCETLALADFRTVEAANAELGLKILADKDISLIISDVQMPGINGDEFLRIAKLQCPEIPFVLMTAHGDIDGAVEAMKLGANDYLSKPFQAEILIELAERMCREPRATGNMVAEDPKSQELTDLARRVAGTSVTVMISGESGSGKEVFAQFIHQSSVRCEQPFCAINCAAIPEQMLESLLFGYEKGAFTGAYSAKAGKFEQANGGTLLLDEISEIDISLQAKLLRVIQEKEVERLGGNKAIPLDVRIIATTNRDLRKEVIKGNFREDLFYRLNVFPLHLAPLRERRQDILPLAYRFIENFEPRAGITISPEAVEQLRNHAWKGNVRELENAIQRALVLRAGSIIGPEHLIFEDISGDSMVDESSASVENGFLAEDNLAFSMQSEAAAASLETDLKSLERQRILEAVENAPSRKEAARRLGISPRTLRYKMAQFRDQTQQATSLPKTVSA